MGNSFNNACIKIKGSLNKVFAITGRAAAPNDGMSIMFFTLNVKSL